MRTSAFHLLWILLAVVAVNCGDEQEMNVVTTGPVTLDDFKEEFAFERISASTSDKSGRDVVRTASIELEVRSFDTAESTLSQIAIRYHGYASDVSRRQVEGTNGTTATTGRIDLRIPADYFDGMLQYVRAQGVVRSERLTSQDVTEQAIDLDARLKTQRQLEERLLNLLNVKSGALKEIIEIEEKLSSVRENIEMIQSQLRYLKDRVAYATLSITLLEPGAGDSVGEDAPGLLEDAINAGLDTVGALMAGAVEWLIILVPVSLVIFLLYRLRRPLVKRMGRRVATSDSSESD